MADGMGCECFARSAGECDCPDVDWTPREVIDLRQQLAEREKELAEARELIATLNTRFTDDERIREMELAVQSCENFYRERLDALAIQLKQMRAAIDSFDLREGTCDAMLVLESRNLATTDHEAVIRQHDAEVWGQAAEICDAMILYSGEECADALRAEAEKLK